MKALAGKVAIVTGAGQGVGLGIAQAMADSGANIVITGRDAAKLERAAADIRARGVEALVCPGDVRERGSADRTVAATVARFGRLDILVNNAQIAVIGKPLSDFDDENIMAVIGSGLLGSLYFMQAALPHLKVRGGSIINLGSYEGIHGSKGSGIYAATKEGIRGLSRTAAREWGEFKIRVNVLNPAALSPGAVEFLESHPKEAEMYRANIALGYFGDSEADIGPVAVFLASDAGRYVTGQTINVDGGQAML
ncbi:MAG: SDR family NAD(P)-dependent oxidoreductase [Gammaproteobacteria bacterium]